MKKSIRQYTFSFVIWILITAIALFTMPNVNQLTREHGSVNLPNSAQSQRAEKIQDTKWGHHLANTYEVVAVFNNGNSKLTSKQQGRINKTISKLQNHKSRYGIKNITAPQDNAITQKQLISKDKTTEIVQLSVSKKHGTIKHVNKQLSNAIKTSHVSTYVTGSDVLNDDFSGAVQEGIKKTEVISVIFIFIVLLLVFRSVVTPLISLLTVAVSFLTSFSIVTNLVKSLGFPFSNFTQVFMVIVLFGIGTDYNILLYNQFKENLGKGMGTLEATKDAWKKAGRTILYSGSSLLIGFTSLALAKFSLYQSAVGVAVGVAVLLIVLLTLNPFFMAVLGKKMFWPEKRFTGESNSRIWRRLSTTAVGHSIISLVLVFVILLPIGLSYQKHLNYDDTAEISSKISSKKGLQVVEDHFSKGTAEPVTIYIHANHKLNRESDLMVIDRLTNQLKKDNDVKSVMSVTQPGGTKISQLYLNNQLSQLTGQLGTASSSLSQLQSGMQAQSAAASAMTSSSAASAQQAQAQQAQQAQMAGQLTQFSSGLQTGSQYLTGLQNSAAGKSTFYLPASEANNAAIQQSYNNYLSADKKTAKFTVILKTNPSSDNAVNTVNKLRKLTTYSIKGTSLKGSEVAVGGQSAKISDYKKYSSEDFTRTAIIMIVGIGLALIVVTRSLLQPVYILGTLVTAYLAALAITHQLTILFLGRSMLTWNTPFFSFIMLLALGVDYNIFLAMRYHDYDPNKFLPSERIIKASAVIGTVVISAALILAGTFAALIPSGIPTLIEVAMTVIVGLFILVVIIPLVIPSTIHLTYPLKDNFRKDKDK